ncbi:RlpA-like double-psi beta-barrel-protein domain-containing protein-containing protein, partial [Microdochium bolleyi]
QASYKGDLTFYAPGLGACGTTSTEDDAIASVSHILFDAAATSGNPNDNPLCGRRIRITRENQGGSRGSKGRRSSSSVEVTVVDRCEGCAAADLDLSPAAFRRLAPESAGRVEGTWSW